MPLNIVRGLVRGASRGVMTGKRGNKNFYKGEFCNDRPPVQTAKTQGGGIIKFLVVVCDH